MNKIVTDQEKKKDMPQEDDFSLKHNFIKQKKFKNIFK